MQTGNDLKIGAAMVLSSGRCCAADVRAGLAVTKRWRPLVTS